MRKQKGEEITVWGVGLKDRRGTHTPSFLRNKYNKWCPKDSVNDIYIVFPILCNLTKTFYGVSASTKIVDDE